jgi:hypothetical protein
MNPRHTSLNTPGAAEARRDLHRRDIVDQAIVQAGSTGSIGAVEYLKSHAISGRIIARVLLEPGKRRNHPGAVPA